MKNVYGITLLLLTLATSAFAGVTVSSPTAARRYSRCSMYDCDDVYLRKRRCFNGIYVNNKKYMWSMEDAEYADLLSTGSQHTVVEEWISVAASTTRST